MMEKVTKLKNLEGTFVFTIDSLVPFKETDLKKIRDHKSCDNIEVISPNTIRITQVIVDGSVEGGIPIDRTDDENNWGEIQAQVIKNDIRSHLRSIRKSYNSIRFRKTQIFLT